MRQTGLFVTVAAVDVAVDLLVERFAQPGSLGVLELVLLHAGLSSKPLLRPLQPSRNEQPSEDDRQPGASCNGNSRLYEARPVDNAVNSEGPAEHSQPAGSVQSSSDCFQPEASSHGLENGAGHPAHDALDGKDQGQHSHPCDEQPRADTGQPTAHCNGYSKGNGHHQKCALADGGGLAEPVTSHEGHLPVHEQQGLQSPQAGRSHIRTVLPGRRQQTADARGTGDTHS